jgi:hypothetical protein
MYQGTVSPASSSAFVVICFLIIAILTDVRWNLSVVLVYISFMAEDVEHFLYICQPFELLLGTVQFI